MAFQSVEMRLPEPAIGREPVVQLSQGLRSDAIQAALAVRASFDQTGLFKHPQVLGDGRLAETELVHQLPDGSLAVPEQIENGLSAGLAQNLEGAKRCHENQVYARRYISIKLYIDGRKAGVA